MKKIYNKIIVTLILAIFFGLFRVNSVLADDNPDTSMFVTPMTQEILLIPGETYEGVISVSNAANSLKDLKYLVKIGSYGRVRGADDKDDYGAVDVQSRTDQNLMMDWIALSRTSGIVEPNGADRIHFLINVPADAPAGAQMATILVIRDDSDTTDGKEDNNIISIQNVYQFASAIIANVAGKTIEKASLMDNSIPSILFSNNLEASSMLKNEGNIYTNVEYTLRITPFFGGDDICNNEENPDIKLVLPSTEKYNVQSCVLPSVGLFKAKQTIKIFNETFTVEKMVIVCPLWLLSVVIFAIILLIMWLVMKAKARNKQK